MVLAQNILEWGGGGAGNETASQPVALKMALQIQVADVATYQTTL